MRLLAAGDIGEILRRIFKWNRNGELDPEILIEREIPIPLAGQPSIRPMRILFVSHTLLPEGAPISLFELVRGLMESFDISVSLLAMGDGPLHAEYGKLGVPVSIWVPSDDSRLTAKGNDKAKSDLAELFTRIKPDLVFVNTLDAFRAISAAHAGGVPSIWNIRESEPWDEHFSTLSLKVQKEALRAFGCASKFIFVAEETRRLWTAMTQGRSQTIHNALDVRRLIALETEAQPKERIRCQLGIDLNNIMILCVGTICDRKGQADLIMAFAGMSDDAIDRSHIVLKGRMIKDYEPNIRRALSALSDAQKIRVHILAETMDAIELYQAADIFVCTSYLESYPRVILEAMYHALPIVTTEVFGIKEQIKSRETALTFLPGNVSQLAGHLTQLTMSEVQRTNLGTAAREAFEEHSKFSDMVEEYAIVLGIRPDTANKIEC